MNQLIDRIRNMCLSHIPLIQLLGGQKIYYFFAGEENAAQSNLGRMPLVLMRAETVKYDFESEPYHGSTRTMTLLFRVFVPFFVNRQQSAFEQLNNIKMELLRSLKNSPYTDFRQLEGPTQGQSCLYMDIEVDFETTYDEEIDE